VQRRLPSDSTASLSPAEELAEAARAHDLAGGGLDRPFAEFVERVAVRRGEPLAHGVAGAWRCDAASIGKRASLTGPRRAVPFRSPRVTVLRLDMTAVITTICGRAGTFPA
jgi:hypothetical protein